MMRMMILMIFGDNIDDDEFDGNIDDFLWQYWWQWIWWWYWWLPKMMTMLVIFDDNIDYGKYCDDIDDFLRWWQCWWSYRCNKLLLLVPLLLLLNLQLTFFSLMITLKTVINILISYSKHHQNSHWYPQNFHSYHQHCHWYFNDDHVIKIYLDFQGCLALSDRFLQENIFIKTRQQIYVRKNIFENSVTVKSENGDI